MHGKFAASFGTFVIGAFLAAAAVASPDSIDAGSISGLGARNIGSAAMSGRISALAGYTDPSGKMTLFVGAEIGRAHV